MKKTDQNQAGNGELSYYPRSRLAYRLLIYILICGSALTLIATTIQLYFSYKVDINRIDQNLQFIENSYVPAIASSVYKVDMEQMELQLKGILQLPDITHARIREPRGNDEFVLSQGDDNARRDMIHSYPLAYQVESNEIVPLGKLTVAATKAQVWSRLWGRIVVILLTNSAKTLITCLCILGIFHLFLIRHLQSINQAIVTWNPNKANRSLKLERKRSNEHPRKGDELDAVVQSLNRMWRWIDSDKNTIKAVQSSLKESNERFKAYMENSTEAIWCFDLTEPIDISLPVEEQLELIYEHAYVSDANDAYAQLAGLESREQLIGITLAELVPRDKPENVAMLMELIRNRYTTVGHESIERYPSGEERILLNNSIGIIEDGIMHRAWGTALDITERKKVEKELREAERRYRTVADFTFDWEIWESPEGKILYISPSCKRITGYSTEEYLDDPELMQKIVLPEDRSIWTDHRHAAMKKPELLEIQYRIRTKDGEIRWIEHACQPVYDTDGTSLGIRSSNRDITSRKQAEEELKKKDKLLMEAQRIAQLGSWDWNIITNELVWSDEVFRIFGLSPQEFEATYEAFLERIHPDDLAEVKEAVDRSITDPSIAYNAAHRIVTPLGIERVVRERGNVTFDEKGRAIRMIGTVQDITDIKIMEAETQKMRSELAHMDRSSMMGVLTAGIAHEINQPLAAILSNAQAALRFLTKDHPDIDEVEEILRDIISDDKRAGEIVHSIRNILGQSESPKEEIDLNETIREVLTLIKSELINRKIFLTEDLTPDIPKVLVNRIQIQQVILNLLMNALEAIDVDHEKISEIHVSTRVDENQKVVMSVSDSGPGIKVDQLTTIFDSFHTSKKGGLGVGLSICRSIIEDHGGLIWAENRTDGGAVFSFKLPSGEEPNE